MTVVKETRHVFEVKHILALRVKCKNCSNEVAMRLQNDQLLPDNCPMCKDQKWLAGSAGARLLKSLRAVLEGNADMGGTILMEIAEGKDG